MSLGAWTAVGLAIGVALLVATDQPAFIAVGLALGLGLGSVKKRSDRSGS